MEHADIFQIHFPNHISNNTQLEPDTMRMYPRCMFVDYVDTFSCVDIKCRYIL